MAILLLKSQERLERDVTLVARADYHRYQR
jgi:hypothetical protein